MCSRRPERSFTCSWAPGHGLACGRLSTRLVLTDLDVPGGIYKNVATLQLSVLQLKSFEIHKSVNNLERHQRLSAQRRQEGGWCTCPSIDAKRISFSNGFPAISESESGMNSNAAKAFPLNVKKR